MPNVPENTRAAVYLPPSTVVKELPDAHETIAFIVQAFIEQVGIPTIDRWTVAAKNHLNFSLTMSGRAPIKSYTSFIPPPVKVGYAHYIFQGLPSRTVMHCTNCFQVQGRAEYSPDGRRDLSNGEPGEVAETYDREYGIHFAELETGYLEQISSLGAEVKQYQERIISLEEEIVRLNVILKDRESVLPPHSSPGVHLRAPRSMVRSLLMQMNHTNLVPIRLFRHLHVTGLGPQLTVQPRSPCSLRVARTAPLPSELTWISLIVSEF